MLLEDPVDNENDDTQCTKTIEFTVTADMQRLQGYLHRPGFLVHITVQVVHLMYSWSTNIYI